MPATECGCDGKAKLPDMGFQPVPFARVRAGSIPCEFDKGCCAESWPKTGDDNGSIFKDPVGERPAAPMVPFHVITTFRDEGDCDLREQAPNGRRRRR